MYLLNANGGQRSKTIIGEIIGIAWQHRVHHRLALKSLVAEMISHTSSKRETAEKREMSRRPVAECLKICWQSSGDELSTSLTSRCFSADAARKAGAKEMPHQPRLLADKAPSRVDESMLFKHSALRAPRVCTAWRHHVGLSFKYDGGDGIIFGAEALA